MNKYQEALNVLYENVDYNDYSNQTIDRTNKAFDTLQELVDKSTPKKVKKKIKAVSPIHDIVIGTCLNCGEEDLKENCNYCSNCGQKLNWKWKGEKNYEINKRFKNASRWHNL